MKSSLGIRGSLEKLTTSPSLKRVLAKRYDKEQVSRIMTRMWEDYALQIPKIPRQKTLGSSLVIRFNAMAIATYRALLAEGIRPDDARKDVYLFAWSNYKLSSGLAWLLTSYSGSRLMHTHRAMKLFRRMSFPSPDFGWEEMTPSATRVGFNCTKCPIAEYWASQNLSDVCVESICSLDNQLSKQWGVRFVLSNTIAGGSNHCDFRWGKTIELSNQEMEPTPKKGG